MYSLWQYSGTRSTPPGLRRRFLLVEGDAEQLGVMPVLGGACGLLLVAELVSSASPIAFPPTS
jgi:hypothetical protein